jgi:hypothetical protein
MDKAEIENRLIEVISEVQKLSGCKDENVDGTTVPIMDLVDFDSLRGAETTTLLMEKLRKKVPVGKDDNIFVSEDGRRALRVNEIVDRLVQLIKT